MINLPEGCKVISLEGGEKMESNLLEAIRDEIKASQASINERKPKFKVSINMPFTKLETCVNFMKKARETFKDADLEINVHDIRI